VRFCQIWRCKTYPGDSWKSQTLAVSANTLFDIKCSRGYSCNTCFCGDWKSKPGYNCRIISTASLFISEVLTVDKRRICIETGKPSPCTGPFILARMLRLQRFQNTYKAIDSSSRVQAIYKTISSYRYNQSSQASLTETHLTNQVIRHCVLANGATTYKGGPIPEKTQVRWK
jgi:hypothetical protein